MMKSNMWNKLNYIPFNNKKITHFFVSSSQTQIFITNDHLLDWFSKYYNELEFDKSKNIILNFTENNK